MGSTTHLARRRRRALIGTVAALGLLVAACSKKDDDTTAATAAPAVTDAAAATDASSEATTPAGTDAPAGPEGSDGTEAPAGTEAPVETDAPADTTAPVEDEGDPVYGGTLIVSGEAEVTNPWTPAAMQCDQYCYQRAGTFYETLLVRGTDGELHGGLAETWESNADYTLWTFHIRPGIKFHDGTPLDAAAVVYNLREHGPSLLTAAALVDIGREADGNFAITATGPMDVEIRTGKGGDLSQPRPWAVLPIYFLGQLGYVASPTWLEAVKAGTADPVMAVGTGPFIVKSYAPAEKLVVERNSDYWRKDAKGNQLPYLDGIEFRVIEDSETAGQALQNGDIDIFGTSASAVISQFRDLADTYPMIETSEKGETGYAMIDHDKVGPLQDSRVRCALWKAIDRQELIDLTSDGLNQVANGLFSPGQEGYLEDNGMPTGQDIEGAQALLDEYTAENPGTVKVKYGTTVSTINQQIGQLLAQYWEAIGVQTEIIQIPQDQFITKALFGDPDFEIFGWRQHSGSEVDAQYLWWHSSGAQPDGGLSLNFARLRDDIVDQNLDLARGEADPDKRRGYAENVNREMAKECHAIALSWTIWGVPYNAALRGVTAATAPDGTPAELGGGYFSPSTMWFAV